MDVHVDEYVYVDELERNVGELDSKVSEGFLAQSIIMVLITTQEHP